MNEHTPTKQANRLCLMAALGGAASACVTGIACMGPLLGIALGIGGLGGLARYSFLQVPATLMTATLLVAGFALLRRRTRHCGFPRYLRSGRIALWAAALLAIAVNVFEYLVLPRLG